MNARSATLSPTPDSPERGAWDSVRAGWRQLFGGFDELGISVEMQEFRTSAPLNWAHSFHRESVEICLNLAGRGEVAQRRQRLSLENESAGFYIAGDDAMTAERRGGEAHRFVTLEFSREFVARQLAGSEDEVEPVLKRGLLGDRVRSAVGSMRRFGSGERMLAASFCRPPVPPAALPVWYHSKVLEAMAQFFYAPAPELFCTRQKRAARERVQRAVEILRARLEAPPSLEKLGRAVGVSQFYLSRIFSEEMQMTIPQFLRRIRMERAAELLREGGHNVTEAAFAVGYSSLGHFSKSFCEVIGCCPTLYPFARHFCRERDNTWS